MSDINHSRMIPLHIADQAVAACEKEIAALKAEVDRLRKAGDALAEAVGDPTIDWPPREAAWNAAKDTPPNA